MGLRRGMQWGMLLGGLVAGVPALQAADNNGAQGELEADIPPFARGLDKEAYLQARAAEVGLRRGIEPGRPYDPTQRILALQELEAEQRAAAPELSAYTWTSVGPEPIPNGQTSPSVAVSGRTIAIAVHPTDPDKVYAGTANGGLYRSLDGGASWKALMDSAQSLAVGAVTLDLGNPSTVWVGTGEGNGSADSFAGVGIYRIINAESAAPTLEGPFGTRVAGCGSPVDNGVAFLGTSITRIVFDPLNNNRMWVGNTTGVAGIGVGVGLGGSNGRIGLWLSENPGAATPTFALCSDTGAGTRAIKDIVVEPGNANNMLFHLVDRAAGNALTGVYRTTNAAAASVAGNTSFTSTRVINLNATTLNGELAIQKTGATVTVLSAHGLSTGRVQKSTDGGATFGAALASGNNFCGGQCFYDIAVALDPSNANNMYIAGATAPIFARSTDGTNFAASSGGLHADSHAIAIAPSNPAVIYTGNDGGIYRSSNSGVSWTSLNVAGFNATQFMSMATHASDPEFMIGGTQDNGTELKRADGTWTRTDFGDGGFSAIDQSSTSLASIRMYHTYFNSTASPLVAYATSTSPTAFENWTVRGCNGVAGNGISCTHTAVRFYAPLALGPGTPNTVYFGSDRLFRSADNGVNHTTVSQNPITSGVPITAIGIAPSSDNVRLVGLQNGGIFRTTTGAATLNSVDPVGVGSVVPDFIVARAAIDRNNADIAYVTLSGFAPAGQGIYRTANLSNAAPAWTARSSGIPSIPINAFVIDPRNSAHLYAGTDIGVYRSTDSGANWTAFSSGLPRVPVFDMAFQGATLASGVHTLRIATHGRGIWEIAIQSPPTATTEVATDISRTGATLQGIVNSNLASATVSFEYGTTLAYGTTVAATPGTVNSVSDTAVSAIISGLTPNTLYNFRVRATNATGTTLGQNRTFFTNDQGLQVGSITIGASKRADFNRVTRVRFLQEFPATPVVVAQPSNEDADPTALRVINVSPTSFDVLQVEAPGCAGCTGANGTMTVHWIAAMPGAYRLRSVAGNTTVEVKAGTVSTTATQRNTASGFAGWPATAWQSVVFPADPPPGMPAGSSAPKFAAPPVLLTGLQSWTAANEGANLSPSGAQTTLTGTSQPWATTVARNVTASGFDVALEASEVDDDDVLPAGFGSNEVIGWIAIQSGVAARLTPYGGGTAIGLATGTGTATDACSNVDLSFPPGTTITVASLRGFAGKQSRADADGGWLRRCALSSPAANTVRIATRVDEDADLDAERTHATAESTGNAVFGGDFSTTPVTLAQFSSQRSGDLLEVHFSSATEIGHLGYRIWGRESARTDWRPLHEALIVGGRGDSHRPQSYTQRLLAAGINELRLEDQDIRGQSRFHAPIAVGVARGAAPGWPALDWSAIRTANARSIQVPRGGVNTVLADVLSAGVQAVSVGQLQAAGLAVDAQNVHQLAVLDGALPLLRHVECTSFGPQCTLEWLGRPRTSLYGPAHAYSIRVDANAARPVGPGALSSHAAAPRTVPGEYVSMANRAYSFSAPGSDPWYDQRLVATTAPVQLERSFSLPERATGAVTLELLLWGGLDYPGDSPDHSVEVLLNGTLLDARRFDGLVEQKINLTLPDSVLSTTNTLTIRLPADTGHAADVVLLDGFRVRYARLSNAVAGELQVGAPDPVLAEASVRLYGSGFEADVGFAIGNLVGGEVMWAQAGSTLYREVLPAGIAAVRPDVTALTVAGPARIAEPQLRAAPSAVSPQPVDYLILTHPLFAGALQPLVTLQQQRGYSVRVVSTDAVLAGAGHDFGPQPLKAFIDASAPRFVLLVGGDSYDYANHLALGAQSLLPTWYVAADPIVRFAATDFPYTDGDGDGLPERALGRIPARTLVEFERALTSILERAAAPAPRYFAAAGGSAGGEYFDLHSRALLSWLRQGQPQDFALVDEVGLADARTATLNALAGAADWINYLGHSAPNRWSFDPLLDTAQLGSVVRQGPPAIVSQLGCWNNYFVLPDQDTMAHALLLRENRLAAAVIGSSNLAEDASHLALGTRFFDLIEDGRFGDAPGPAIATIGEALLAAKRALLRDAPEHAAAAQSLQLFGDPAQPLR